MAASRYLEAKLLAHSLKKTEFTMPAKVYVALCTAAPTKASTGSTITEASYTGYERKEFSGWEAAKEGDPGTIVNETAIAIKVATAGESTVTDFAIVDASTAGNVLYFGKLKEALTIKAALTAVEFKAKELEVTAE